MGKADLPGLEGGHAGRKAMDLFAGGDRPGSRRPGEVAVMADPVDGTDRALGVVLVGGGEHGGRGREAEFEQIDAVTEPDQVIAELRRGELEGRFHDEPLDRLDQGLERIPGHRRITHSCSIEHMFGPRKRSFRRHTRLMAGPVVAERKGGYVADRKTKRVGVTLGSVITVVASLHALDLKSSLSQLDPI